MADELGCFCRFAEHHLRLEDGRPLIVEGFQKKMLSDYFNGATETIILTPKKQGKSTLTASVALFHLVTTPDAECVVVASVEGAGRDPVQLRRSHDRSHELDEQPICRGFPL